MLRSALCCFELASEAEHVFADFNFFNRGRDLGTVAVSLWSPLIITLLCQASLFHCHAIVFTMFRFFCFQKTYISFGNTMFCNNLIQTILCQHTCSMRTFSAPSPHLLRTSAHLLRTFSAPSPHLLRTFSALSPPIWLCLFNIDRFVFVICIDFISF